MTETFDSRYGLLASASKQALEAHLAGGRKGVEKECLRVGPTGWLSQEPHPRALGSALTNDFITTDFSEALLEFVTPAFSHTWETLRVLCDIHQFVYAKLDDEMLWPASMPCRIPADDEIPLAYYGDSNVGRMKTIYRRGLGYRYGRHMQTIAGVHFNYSLPDSFWGFYRDLVRAGEDEDIFRSARYMGLVRNFRRFGWLLLYLFGASPALCKSFARGREISMPSLNDSTWYEPFGTSLRMSDLGYNNQNQSRINICLNSLDAYIRDLSAAIRTPEPAYERIGVKVDGEYRQLSANLLQIENEYYSTIRPKRVAHSGERPTGALRRGGVEYVEVRALDISLADPCGISQNTMRFLEAFLVYCLLEDSPAIDENGLEETRYNQSATAREGRCPGLLLRREGSALALSVWAAEILEKVAAVAGLIDQAEGADSYSAATKEMRRLVEEPESTPSARIVADLQANNCGFFDLAMAAAQQHKAYFRAIERLPDERQALLEDAALHSLRRQLDIEQSDQVTFDEYLRQYFGADTGS